MFNLTDKFIGGCLNGYYETYPIDEVIGRLIRIFGEDKILNSGDGYKSTVDLNCEIKLGNKIVQTIQFTLYNYKDGNYFHIGGRNDAQTVTRIIEYLDNLFAQIQPVPFKTKNNYTDEIIELV